MATTTSIPYKLTEKENLWLIGKTDSEVKYITLTPATYGSQRRITFWAKKPNTSNDGLLNWVYENKYISLYLFEPLKENVIYRIVK